MEGMNQRGSNVKISIFFIAHNIHNAGRAYVLLHFSHAHYRSNVFFLRISRLCEEKPSSCLQIQFNTANLYRGLPLLSRLFFLAMHILSHHSRFLSSLLLAGIPRQAYYIYKYALSINIILVINISSTFIVIELRGLVGNWYVKKMPLFSGSNHRRRHGITANTINIVHFHICCCCRLRWVCVYFRCLLLALCTRAHRIYKQK